MITITFKDEQDLKNWILMKTPVLVRTKPGAPFRPPFSSNKAKKQYEEGLLIELLVKAKENE